MKALRRIAALSGRLLFVGGALIAMQWIWRLWLGVQQWKAHFKEVMPESMFQRYLISPFLPLVIAAVVLLLLGLIPSHKLPRRLLAGVIVLAASLALLTPDSFGHDMGHCVIQECSGRLGELHLWGCLCIAGAAILGVALVEAIGLKTSEPVIAPNGAPATLVGNPRGVEGPPSVS